MKFDIKTATLRAAVQFAAVKDARYYLLGVYVTKGRVVATDGLIMGVFEAPGAAGDVILPLALIQQVLKAAKKAGLVEVEILEGKVSMTVGGATFSGALIDGTFPDYRRVIPTTAPSEGATAQFDLALLERAYAGVAAYYNVKPNVLRLEHNGPAPGVVWHPGDIGAVGIIMPLRSNANAEELSARLRWAKED